MHHRARLQRPGILNPWLLYRPLEIVTSRQWYIRDGAHDPGLRDTLIALGRELRWHPEFMRLRYEHWVAGLNTDWLVSRQRYFGVPFPVWYRVADSGETLWDEPILPDESARELRDRRRLRSRDAPAADRDHRPPAAGSPATGFGVDHRLRVLGGPAMSEYQYYEFLAVDRPLTAAEQAEVRQLSTRARITATSFTNEYEWGDFKGSPGQLMQRYYDAHLYLANWGTHRIMLRLPRTLLDPEIAGRYCAGGAVSVSATRDYVILDLTSEDEAGEWVEVAEDSLAAIVGVRSELAAGDLRPLYLAWLSSYGVPDRDEDTFGDEDEEELEPPVPAGLGLLTAPQRALADFLRLDSGLLHVAAEASPGLPDVKDDARALATHIAELPVSDKDRLLMLVAADQAARARMELLRGFRRDPDEQRDSPPHRTVAELLDTAAARCLEREQRAAAVAAAQQALREQQRAAARQRRLDELAQDPEATWADADRLISTRQPAQYDAAITLLKDLQELAEREEQAQAFARRVTALREAHLRKSSLIDRLDRAGLTVYSK